MSNRFPCLWAALIALMNQQTGKPAGLLQPKLYATTKALRDITSGNNGAYQAGPGWDACTGLGSPDGLAVLGNRIEALESVPTAIASFALTPESFEETIANVIFLGGDTDTLAAMAGAVAGAYLGSDRLPKRLIDLMESSPKGRAHLIELADKLLTAHHQVRDA